MNLVMYIYVNKSLQMSSGKVGAMCAQAAVGSYLKSDKTARNSWWYTGGHHTTLIMEAADERHLSNIQDYLNDRGFNSFMMIDEGMTEIDPFSLTALASEIVDKDDPHTAATFSSFKLYRDIIEAQIRIER